jgi:hypothetical protein
VYCEKQCLKIRFQAQATDLRCSEQLTFLKYLDSVLSYCIFCSKNLPEIVKNALLEKNSKLFFPFFIFICQNIPTSECYSIKISGKIHSLHRIKWFQKLLIFWQCTVCAVRSAAKIWRRSEDNWNFGNFSNMTNTIVLLWR